MRSAPARTPHSTTADAASRPAPPARVPPRSRHRPKPHKRRTTSKYQALDVEAHPMAHRVPARKILRLPSGRHQHPIPPALPALGTLLPCAIRRSNPVLARRHRRFQCYPGCHCAGVVRAPIGKRQQNLCSRQCSRPKTGQLSKFFGKISDAQRGDKEVTPAQPAGVSVGMPVPPAAGLGPPAICRARVIHPLYMMT